MTSKPNDKQPKPKQQKRGGLVAWLNQDIDLFDPKTWLAADGNKSQRRR